VKQAHSTLADPAVVFHMFTQIICNYKQNLWNRRLRLQVGSI
jgi:hypothetical protein